MVEQAPWEEFDLKGISAKLTSSDRNLRSITKALIAFSRRGDIVEPKIQYKISQLCDVFHIKADSISLLITHQSGIVTLILTKVGKQLASFHPDLPVFSISQKISEILEQWT